MNRYCETLQKPKQSKFKNAVITRFSIENRSNLFFWIATKILADFLAMTMDFLSDCHEYGFCIKTRFSQ
ncbi:hypothetical protein [Helicobacter sp. T3_23-1056]